MFFIITGAPGASKTLNVIDKLRHEKKRTIYYSGIPDLKLPWIKLDDPKNFHEQVDVGSIVVIDEAQTFFPVRDHKNPVPDALKFMEQHRHKGLDVYFITQHPSLLDHHARRLINEHVHLQRNFGMPFSVRYTSSKLIDPSNWHDLQAAQKENYRYPKDVFALYKSAEVHTHKPRLPKKLLLLIPCFLLLGFGVNWVYSFLHKSDLAVLPQQHQIDHGQSSGSGSGSVSQPARKAIDWHTAFIPRVQGVPYTAPIYDKLAVPVVMPVVSGCVASATLCRCYTQQATIIAMSEDQCRITLKARAFNPFKKDDNYSVSRGERQSEKPPGGFTAAAQY